MDILRYVCIDVDIYIYYLMFRTYPKYCTIEQLNQTEII
jgi:hypothetical protein